MREYLVNYGLGGFLGRFRAAEAYCRDDRVVVQSARGAELGSVLGEAPTRTLGLEFAGDILRHAGEDDLAAVDSLRDRAATLVADAHQQAQALGLPLLFLDCEILLDGRDAILHAVHWAECDATPLFEELSRQHGLHVRLADLTTEPKSGGCPVCGEAKSGCDSCGTGGGCSSGSCSKGSIKSADELTAYFAGLRKQMEATAARVSLH
jgi:cell fate regulator YaaT (PSP1 superfamily)